MSVTGLAAALVTVGLLGAGCAAAPGRAAAVRDDVRTTVSTAAATAVTVVAAGDIACPPGSRITTTTCQQAATAALAQRFVPSVAIPLGDEQYPDGSQAQFTGSYAKSWGALRTISRPVPGNHEYQTPGASGYYAYFAGQQPGAPGYYRVAVGAWQLYLLNSNCTKISCHDEQVWLSHEMTAHPSACSLIAMHHPRFSSGSEHGNNIAVRGLWAVALNHGVDIALAGHDHDYERFNRLDNDGHYSARGITSFVVGTGGKSHHPIGTRKRGSAYFNSTRFGVLRLALAPGQVTWGFRTTTGVTLDHGTRSCG